MYFHRKNMIKCLFNKGDNIMDKSKVHSMVKSFLVTMLCLIICLGAVACGGGDGTVTFHYGFDTQKVKLDKNGKASKYTDTVDIKSVNGKRVVLSTKIKDSFEVKGYKVIGYSTTDWQKDGITSNINVYVLYRKLKSYKITFLNPDNSKIKTITKYENESLTERDFPDESSIKIKAGLDFIGWDTTYVDSVEKDMKIKAMEGGMVTFEAEKQKYSNSTGAAVVVTEANEESGKSIYMNAYPKEGEVTIDFTVYAKQETKLIWDINMGFRGGGENNLSDNMIFTTKMAGESVYSEVVSNGVIRNENWDVKWGDMGTATVSTIVLKQGENHLSIKGIKYLVANIDSISLKGETQGVYYKPYKLTLSGATFSNGNSVMDVEAGSKVPKRINVENLGKNQEVVGWTDGSTKWTINDFEMPEKDITISPIIGEKKKEVTPKNVKPNNKSKITIDGKKDEGYTKVDSSLKETTIAKFVEGSTRYNENNYADVYMSAKDNGVYVYIEVTDDIVVSAGKNYFDGDSTINFRNDMIEFWFVYNDITSKIQIDAFGYKVASNDDGIAIGHSKMSDVKYATTLIGDDNLSSYKSSGDPVVTKAKGYTIEFWLPLVEKGESISETSMKWALQLNSIDTVSRYPVSVNGHQLKTEAKQATVGKVFTVNFK